MTHDEAKMLAFYRSLPNEDLLHLRDAFEADIADTHQRLTTLIATATERKALIDAVLIERDGSEADPRR